jgi:hypothetical protein
VEGRRNSRKKKSTPSIQNYKTPKQQKMKNQLSKELSRELTL